MSIKNQILNPGQHSVWSEIAYGVRELLFHAICRHRQGDAPNILLYCTRRSGSTWILNTLASHPGVRYVNRPFMTAYLSRHRKYMPLEVCSAESSHLEPQRHLLGGTPAQLEHFKPFAGNVINGRTEVYPSLNIRGRYFRRHSDRIAFQMTTGQPLIEWFADEFDVQTAILMRHPISNALSIMERSWPPESAALLSCPSFVDQHLTSQQVDLARIISNGSNLLEQHVLDWCLLHTVPFHAWRSGRRPDWSLLTYEDCVMQPDATVRYMATRFELSDQDAMRTQIKAPSRTVSAETADRVDQHDYVLRRWRSAISPEQERSAMRILEAFGIDAYRVGDDMPAAGLAGSVTAKARQTVKT